MGDGLVDTGRLRTYVRTAGPEGAPTVVLLHALGETSESWSPVVPLLSGSYRTVVPDLRGHGRTEWRGPYALEGMSDDVVALLDALGLERVHVVGHSLGGVLAYLLAERYPDRVAALVLEDPPAPRPRPRSSPQRPEGELEFDWALVAPLVAEADEPPRRWWDDLTRITARTLVIGGGAASHIDQGALAAMADRIPAASFTTIPVGHLVHVERPVELADLVLAHLAPTG